MIHSAFALAMFALSVGAFSVTLAAGLFLALKGNSIGAPFCFQTLSFGSMIFLPNLSSFLSGGQNWFGGAGYQALFLGVYSLNLVALGLYLHALIERPFRGWSRTVTLASAFLGLGWAAFELISRLLGKVDPWRNFWETWDMSLIGLVEIVVLVAVLVARWKHIRSRLRRQLAGFLISCALFAFGFSTINLRFIGFNTVSPISVENLCLLFYCAGNGFLLIREAFSRSPGFPRPVLKPESDLTDRERQVVQLLNEGLSNKEAAFHLGVSDSTIKNHLYNVYKKLGVRSRVELLHRVLLK